MIRLNQYTEIAEPKDPAPDFPKYTFSLTPISELNQYIGNQGAFLDVIEKITAVSNAATLETSSGTIKLRRIIHLVHHSENMIELSLFGPRAQEFDGDTVYEVGRKSHVIAIFVGTSMKQYKGSPPFLSGTATCRWYVNENDVTEIRDFYKRLPIQAEPVKKLHLKNHEEIQRQIETKSLLELREINPFDHAGLKFECTTVIIQVAQNQYWCYPACTACGSRSIFDGGKYHCSKDGCTGTSIEHRYKVCLIASDTTWQLRFMLFQDRAMQLIGKSVEKLLTTYRKSDTPPEISALVGQKFTFIVRVLPEKKLIDHDPMFEVLNIKKIFGKQFQIPDVKIERKPASSTTSTSEEHNLPPLVPICPKAWENKSTSSSSQQIYNIDDSQIELTGILQDKTARKALDMKNEEQLQDTHEKEHLSQRAKRSFYIASRHT